jgi:hypothetical protein
MSVPIACTLSAGQVGDRIEEWRSFFATSVDAVDAAGKDSLRLQVKDDPAELVAAVDLARREVTCCAFFDFSIVIESTRSWLVIEVPPDGREILAGLADLLPSGDPHELRVPTDP